jgi:hypothetical protein
MIASDLADPIGAEPKSRSVWTAKCPICGFNLLKIIGSRHTDADLCCDGGCSICSILSALRLSRDDYASGPRTAPPNFDDMDDLARRDYEVTERERQARHKAACKRINRCRERVAQVNGEIKAVTTSYVPISLTVRLEEAREALIRARRNEKKLHA